MSEAEILQAEVIEDYELTRPSSELHIIKAEPGSDIVSNIAGLKAWVEQQMKTYAVPTIHTEDDYAQAKRDRTSLRSMGATIENERKRIKTIYEAPLKAFEESVKSVTAPIGKLDGQMKEAIDAYDESVKDAKRAVIRQHYEDYAPVIALPLEGQTAALVPYERIEDPKWLNRGITDKAACDDLDKIVDSIASDEATLDGLNLPHLAEAKAEYFATLELKAAIERDRQLTAQEERQKALEAEREARRVEQEAARDSSLAEAKMAARTTSRPQAPAPQTVAKTPEQIVAQAGGVIMDTANRYSVVHIELHDITETQLEGVIDFLKSNGIHGSIMKGEGQR